MRNRIILVATLTATFAGTCVAQKWELGGLGGFGLTQGLSVENRAGASADIGFKNSAVVGLMAGHETYRRLSGEVRYLYRMGAAQLDTGSAQAELEASQHLITYSALYHFSDFGGKIRPYVAFGAGLRVVRGTGQPRAVQPGSSFAYLTPTTDYLAVIALATGRAKDMARILALLESGSATNAAVAALAGRHGLGEAWRRFVARFLE